MQLDQVLRLTTRAIQAVVDPFGGAAFEIGDDEADIEAERRGFDTRDGAPLAGPRTGSVSGLVITAHDVLVFQSAFDANLVGLVIDFFDRGCVPGRPNGIVTPLRDCDWSGGSISRAVQKISYDGYRFPPEIIQRAIWLYLRFTLSFATSKICWRSGGFWSRMRQFGAGSIISGP